MTALAASIGTGNIAGVATAIVSGGPGALFWIWCYGFFATAVKFAEAVLGRALPRSSAAGGCPRVRCTTCGTGWACRGWAGSYALVAGVAALTTTPVHPAQLDRGGAARASSGVPTLATGVVVAVLTWLVIIGGVTSIGRAAEKLAPAKVILYLAGGLLVIGAARRPPARDVRPGLPRGVLAPRGGRQRGRDRDHGGAALRARARNLRERGRLRDGGRSSTGRPAAERPVQQGYAAVHGGVRHLLRDLLDQRAHASW